MSAAYGLGAASDLVGRRRPNSCFDAARRPTLKMRRLSFLLLVAVAALTSAPTAHAATRANWNRGEQEEVATAGLLTRLATAASTANAN
jgi:hypothetical protein